MGAGSFRIKAFGFECGAQWKAANPDDQTKIEAFIEAVGFDKARKILDNAGNLRQTLASYNCEFPQYEADLPEWYDNLTP